MAKKYDAGVKEYRDSYWTPDYVPLDTDLLACFKVTAQEGVPHDEAAAAVAAESSTGTWSTVWSELLTPIVSKMCRVTARVFMLLSPIQSIYLKKARLLTY